MTTYKKMENEYVYKCCEMQITYSTKVKADERIAAITSEKLADVFSQLLPIRHDRILRNHVCRIVR